MKKARIYLLLIIILAIALRIPAIKWQYNLYGNESYEFHPDERWQESNAKKILLGEKEKQAYVVGYSIQISSLQYILDKLDIEANTRILGRLISLFYGITTVLLVYVLAMELTHNNTTSLIAAFFMATSGLHVTQSHYATTDVSGVFWIYAVIYLSILYVRRKDIKYLQISSLCAGIALATKLSYIVAIPLLFALIKSDKRIPNSLTVIFITLLSFTILNYGHTLTDFGRTLGFFYEITNSIEEKNKLWNPIIYFLSLFSAVGMPVMLLCIYGLIVYLKQRRLAVFKDDIFYIIGLPMTLYYTSISTLDSSAVRFTLPMAPTIAITGAYGFVRLSKILDARLTRICLILIFIYQLLYVVSEQY